MVVNLRLQAGNSFMQRIKSGRTSPVVHAHIFHYCCLCSKGFLRFNTLQNNLGQWWPHYICWFASLRDYGLSHKDFWIQSWGKGRKKGLKSNPGRSRQCLTTSRKGKPGKRAEISFPGEDSLSGGPAVVDCDDSREECKEEGRMSPNRNERSVTYF